jgi:hypothetical protein
MPRTARDVSGAPANPKQLQQFVWEYFGIHVPARPLCAGHNAPLDYLAGSFLHQQDLLVWANRGGGKTYLAAIATLLDAVFHGPVRTLVLGGSFDQSDRLAAYIRRLLDAHPRLLDGRMTRQRIPLVGGSEIRILPQSQRAVRGQHVQRIRCDEADLFDPDVWRAVQFSTRSTGGVRGAIEVLSTMHRPGGLMQELVEAARAEDAPAGMPAGPADGAAGYRLIQWCLWEVIERCPPWRRCDDCPLAEDCRGRARRGQGFFRIDDAIAIQARSSRAAWETEMLCKGVRREDLVFPEFDAAAHVEAAKRRADWPLYRAMDFGYRSPLVCLWVQVSPGGLVQVLDEYVQAGLPLPRHAAAIRAGGPAPAAPVAATFVDPAGRQRESTSGAACTEMLAAEGIPCTWRRSNVAEGLELIRAALAPAAGPPSLCIHPRCKRLIRAFETYHWPPGSPTGPSAPVKDGPDHLIDALRYFFVNRARPAAAVQRSWY